MAPQLTERGREQIIIGIDPGTIVMGYAIIAARGRKMRLIAMGVLKLDRYADTYRRLRKIHEGVSQLIARYQPDQLAIEAPFYGKNVQSMLKLGRAQGAAIVAAQLADLPVTEYPPSTIKKMVTGNGSASKEQVAYYLRKMLSIPPEAMMDALDATDATGAAVCHVLSAGRGPVTGGRSSSWRDYLRSHPDKVVK